MKFKLIFLIIMFFIVSACSTTGKKNNSAKINTVKTQPKKYIYSGVKTSKINTVKKIFMITSQPVISPPLTKISKINQSVFSTQLLKEKIKTSLLKKNAPKSLTVFFAFDSSVIPNKEIVKLNKFINTINYPVIVDGYTCSSGPAGYNKTLSLKRALSVKKHLVDKNIGIKTVSGHGEIVSAKPGLNRKVVITERGDAYKKKNNQYLDAVR